MADTGNGGTFINGEVHAVEILTALPPGERQRILQYINARNPQMAKNLSQKCYHFNTLSELEEHELKEFATHFHPKILGLALKGAAVDFQKQILSKLDRRYAETAYEALSMQEVNGRATVKRAQERVVEALGKFLNSRSKK
ncbi:MAG: hypothetical protein OXB88_00425 [Bacteriovoracales bacterium]|nr:hypothetical protein [Bacteriovoracales bacterium]